tara:strand:+ start:235 stop:711 length:477 start_codon:yes stop_codon:yes gene_type:complete
MPKFKENPSPFMKGYSYPGTAPLKTKIDPSKDVVRVTPKGGWETMKGGKWKPVTGIKTTPFKPDMNVRIHGNIPSSKVGKLPKVSKKPASRLGAMVKGFTNVSTQFAKKATKFLGGKALGVAGMMMATSSKADQPKESGKKTNIHWRPNIPGSKMNRK